MPSTSDVVAGQPGVSALDAGGRAEGRETASWVFLAPFAIASFLSAFLLFQVQLLLGKQTLPMFGGAPAVWTTCLLVFQGLLLAGYAFAHGLAARLSLRGQSVTQMFLVGSSLVTLLALNHFWPTPITPGPNWGPAGDAAPVWTIGRFLLAAIGLPFFLLSSTSPLLQHWIARAGSTLSPYRLYALSNAGSLLGLVSYPFLVEPNLRLGTQAWLWVGGYLLYALAYGVCALKAKRAAPAESKSTESDSASSIAASAKPPRNAPFLWTGLATCASVLLLAITNIICQEVAVIPFLWVLPLSLYLLSFILCFESDRWYRRGVFHPLFAAAAGAVILVTLPRKEYSYFAQLVAYCVLLFAGCMVCHGEAAKARPHAAHLTKFYLCISLGGAMGGVFVALIAPSIFPGYWEFPLGVLGCGGLLLFVSMRDPHSWWHTGKSWAAVLILAASAVFLPRIVAPLWAPAQGATKWAQWVAAGLLLCAAPLWYQARRGQEYSTGPLAIRTSSRVALALLTAGLAIPQKADLYHVIAHSRNFYGVLSVVEVQPDNYYILRHGKTAHGFQYREPERAHLPTGYFGRESGANILLGNWPTHPARVGLIGMGVGALAALAQPGDVYRFYEINPEVWRWSSGSRPYFTFLRDSPGQIEVVIGDARLSLEREAQRSEFQKFDVLVLDAFSSDAIPMHLLTREAFAVYLRHLRGRGSVVAAHISNQTLDLRPVLAGIAREYGFHTLRVSAIGLSGPFSASDWVLLSRDENSLSAPELKRAAGPFLGNRYPILWTDDYCNLFRVLR